MTREAAPPRARPEAASFRDPHSRVYYLEDRVLRTLSAQGLAEWDALVESGLAAELIGEGKLVGTARTEGDPAVELPHALDAAAVLEHDRIPFISYPYEWTFGMLQDAALLQLELLRRALDRGSRPQGRDALQRAVARRSPRLRRRRLVRASACRGAVGRLPPVLDALPLPAAPPGMEGRAVPAVAARQPGRDLAAGDALPRLHARPAPSRRVHPRAHAQPPRPPVRGAGRRRQARARLRGLPARADRRQRGRPRAAVSRLEWPPDALDVVGATTRPTSYSADDAARKERFVAEAIAAERPGLCWDIGCNDGRHSRLAAEHSGYVVAMDADHTVVERLYQELKRESAANILPLTIDVVDPSPALGWRHGERKPLVERGRPDLVLCLALLHHVSISANVPVAGIVDWLHGLTEAAVVEFATPDDPMVDRLLARKRDDDHPDYRRDWFEQALFERFDWRGDARARRRHARCCTTSARGVEHERTGASPERRAPGGSVRVRGLAAAARHPRPEPHVLRRARVECRRDRSLHGRAGASCRPQCCSAPSSALGLASPAAARVLHLLFVAGLLVLDRPARADAERVAHGCGSGRRRNRDRRRSDRSLRASEHRALTPQRPDSCAARVRCPVPVRVAGHRLDLRRDPRGAGGRVRARGPASSSSSSTSSARSPSWTAGSGSTPGGSRTSPPSRGTRPGSAARPRSTDSTEGAVPSLLTGRTPQPTRAPVYAQYPRNIFTMLGKRYRMRVVESLTTLCPRDLCRNTRAAQARVVEGTTGVAGLGRGDRLSPPRPAGAVRRPGAGDRRVLGQLRPRRRQDARSARRGAAGRPPAAATSASSRS